MTRLRAVLPDTFRGRLGWITAVICVGWVLVIAARPSPSFASESRAQDVSMCLEQASAINPAAYLGLSGHSALDRNGFTATEEEAHKLNEISELRSQIDLDRLRGMALKQLGDNLVSVTWHGFHGLEFRVREGDALAGQVGDLAAESGVGEHYQVIVVPDGLPERLRAKAMATLAEPDNLELLSSLGVEQATADELCGTIHVWSDNSDLASVGRALAPILGTAVIVNRLEPSDRGNDAIGRDLYSTTQSGGLDYRATGGGRCTSNVPWYRNVGGNNEYFVVTAAHCVPQYQWSSTPNTWGGIWWTTVTTSANVRHGTVDIGTAEATIRYGAELDVAIWPAATAVAHTEARSAINSSTYGYLWHDLGWFQWDPNWSTGTSGGDAVGDTVCHSGVTQGDRPPVASGTRVTCSILLERAFTWSIGSPNASWFYSLRRTGTQSLNVCEGDSGGTVWRQGWLSGVVKGGTGAAGQVGTNACWQRMVYSHVGWMGPAFGLTAPTEFS